MNKIRIHCFEPNNIEGFPSNTYQTIDIDKAAECVKELLANEKSGISRIIIENPLFDDTTYYKEINCQAPMDI